VCCLDVFVVHLVDFFYFFLYFFYFFFFFFFLFFYFFFFFSLFRAFVLPYLCASCGGWRIQEEREQKKKKKKKKKKKRKRFSLFFFFRNTLLLCVFVHFVCKAISVEVYFLSRNEFDDQHECESCVCRGQEEGQMDWAVSLRELAVQAVVGRAQQGVSLSQVRAAGRAGASGRDAGRGLVQLQALRQRVCRLEPRRRAQSLSQVPELAAAAVRGARRAGAARRQGTPCLRGLSWRTRTPLRRPLRLRVRLLGARRDCREGFELKSFLSLHLSVTLGERLTI
jgi:hypothetical protein